MDNYSCDLAIVGAGPAGLSAATSAASEGLEVKVIAEMMGGQAALSPRIENYLGFLGGISGRDLAKRGADQARRFGAHIITPHVAVAVERRTEPPPTTLAVTIDDGSVVLCRAVVLALGASYRRLEVPGAERLTGHGVHYGSALTAARTLAGKPVAVVGGANSSAQSVLYLARYASTVHLLVRGDSLHAMSQYLVDRIKRTPNVSIHFNTEVMAVAGDHRVERVLVSNGAVEALDVAGVFVFIGATPPTRWLRNTVDLDDHGFILANDDLATSVPGVFAVGDVRAGSVKRAASAAGEGAMVVQHVHAYLATV